MWSAIIKIVIWLLVLLTGSKDARDREREAGQSFGRMEAEGDNAKSGLQEVQAVVMARDANRDRVSSDPDSLCKGNDPASAAYRSGPN